MEDVESDHVPRGVFGSVGVVRNGDQEVEDLFRSEGGDQGGLMRWEVRGREAAREVGIGEVGAQSEMGGEDQSARESVASTG